MDIRPITPALASLLLFASHAAQAESKIEVATPKNDSSKYDGDLVIFNMPLATRSIGPLGDGKATESCLPRGSRLRGSGKVALKNDKGESSDQHLFLVESAGSDKDCKTPASTVASGDRIALPDALFASTVHERHGITYGALSVPFKYQLKGERGMTGGGTLGAYAGYRTTFRSVATQLIFFAGATEVDVPTTKDGKPTTESLFGLSYGIGALWTLKSEFTVGVVLGADRVSKSAGYVNNGKPWISVSLGYDFLK